MMLGEWYLPPGECQVILTIPEGTISISHHAIQPLQRREFLRSPYFCQQMSLTTLKPPWSTDQEV